MHRCLVRSPFPTIRYVLCLTALVVAGCDRVPGVSPPPPVLLTLSPESATLAMHGWLRLTARVVNGGFRDTAVGYRSSDTSIALVDGEGTVRVVGFGSARIVASVLNHPTATDSTQLRVPAPAGPYLALLPDTATIYAGDGWLQLGWRVGGVPDTGGATTAVRLASSDTSVLEARPSGLLCARKAGDAVVRGSLIASPATTDSTRIRVLPPVPGVYYAPPTVSIASIVDSAGKEVDRNAVRGTITVNVNLDTPPWRCLPPFVLELSFDGKLWQRSGEIGWGMVRTQAFTADTRAADDAGRPLLPNGTRTLSVAARAANGIVYMSTSLSLVISN